MIIRGVGREEFAGIFDRGNGEYDMGALLDFHILFELNINLDFLVHSYKYIIYSNNINISCYV